jgi:hypothetical protein
MNIDNDYLGMKFIWFFGVVEDRNDPIKLGRVRVRCYGWYSADKNTKVPVENLPWAQIIQPPTSAAMGDIGRSPTGIVEGSWVIGFFLDGVRYQQPIIMGTISGIPQEFANKFKGFNDPNGVYPKRINEPDVNRLSRNDEDLQHINPSLKNSTRTTEVEQANGTGSWNEPVSAYKAEYPRNHVTETESGHIKEYDDTEGQERIHEYHKAGTFYEIDKEGNKVTRIVGDSYEVVAGSDFVNVKGDCNLTIDNNCNTYIKGNWNIQVDGTKTEVVKGFVSETYGNSQSTQVTGNIDIDSKGGRIDLN